MGDLEMKKRVIVRRGRNKEYSDRVRGYERAGFLYGQISSVLEKAKKESKKIKRRRQSDPSSVPHPRHRPVRYHGHPQSASPPTRSHSDQSGPRLLQRIRTNTTPPPMSDQDSDVDRDYIIRGIGGRNAPLDLTGPSGPSGWLGGSVASHARSALMMNRERAQQFSPPAPMMLPPDNQLLAPSTLSMEPSPAVSFRDNLDTLSGLSGLECPSLSSSPM